MIAIRPRSKSGMLRERRATRRKRRRPGERGFDKAKSAAVETLNPAATSLGDATPTRTSKMARRVLGHLDAALSSTQDGLWLRPKTSSARVTRDAANATAQKVCLDFDAAESALDLLVANVLSKCLHAKDDLKKNIEFVQSDLNRVLATGALLTKKRNRRTQRC